MFLVIVLVGVGVLAILRRLRYDASSPPVIMAAVWTLSLAIGSLDLWKVKTTQDDPWSFSTWAALIGSAFAFIVGSCLFVRRTTVDSDFIRARVLQFTSSKRLLLVIFVLHAVGLGVSAYFTSTFMQNTGTIAPLFHEGALDSRHEYQLPGFSFLYLLLIPAVVLNCLYISLNGGPRRNKLMVIPAIAGLFMTVASGSRSEAIEIVLSASVAAGLSSGLGLKRALLIVAMVVSIFGGVMYVRENTSTREVTDLPNQITTIHNDLMANLYVYSATEHNNFQILAESEPPLMWGMRLARSILIWAHMREATNFDAPYAWDIGNTVTWLGDYYLDFGYAGVFLIPFLLGVVCGRTYAGLCRRPSLLLLLAYSVLANGIVFSIVTERFFEPSSIYYLCVYAATAVFAHKRARQQHVPAAIRILTRRPSPMDRAPRN